MSCRDIERLLSEGKPLTAEAERHLAECPGCRALLEAFAQADAVDVPLHPERLRTSMDQLLAELAPVKPLPSDSALILMTLGLLVAFTVLVGLVVGLGGYLALTAGQRFAYYATVLIIGLLFSVAAVAVAIPGAKVRVSNGRVIAGALVALAWVVSALFREFGLDNFVSRGVPCLRLGCICAALFGILAAFLLRRAYVTRVGAAAVLIGSFAGFSGVAVLSLHCRLLNASHIIVWHLGAIVISALAGAAIAWLIEHREPQSAPDSE